MNPFITSLLGQQASVANVPSPLDQQPNNGIVVTAPPAQESRSNPVVDLYEGFSLNNTDAILERENAAAEGAEAAQHRGHFGTKGTLRDILGIIGDAFLIQGGSKPMYRAARERERMGDAMAGFTVDPRAAAERVSGVDPAAAAELLANTQQNEVRTQANETGMMRANTDRADLMRKIRDKAMDSVSQAYAAALTTGDFTAAERLAEQISAQTGIPLEDLGVTTDMTPEQARVLAGRGATVNQNLNLPLAERRVEVAEQNAATSRGRLEQYARSIGLREGSEKWDRLMDMADISIEQQKEQGRERRSKRSAESRSRGRRSFPGTDRTSSPRFGPPRN